MGLRPPGSLARPLCAAYRGSAGSRWPQLVPGSRFARLRAPPLGSPLLRSALPGPQRVAPPGPPLAVRDGASVASLPRSSLPALRAAPAASGPAAPCPGGLRGPAGRSWWPPAPGALAARPRLRGLAGASVAVRWWSWGSPLRPPAPPPPLGAPGAGNQGGGSVLPLTWVRPAR